MSHLAFANRRLIRLLKALKLLHAYPDKVLHSW